MKIGDTWDTFQAVKQTKLQMPYANIYIYIERERETVGIAPVTVADHGVDVVRASGQYTNRE